MIKFCNCEENRYRAENCEDCSNNDEELFEFLGFNAPKNESRFEMELSKNGFEFKDESLL